MFIEAIYQHVQPGHRFIEGDIWQVNSGLGGSFDVQYVGTRDGKLVFQNLDHDYHRWRPEYAFSPQEVYSHIYYLVPQSRVLRAWQNEATDRKGIKNTMTFGIKPEKPVRFWWGARGIYHPSRSRDEAARSGKGTKVRKVPAFVDIPPDRHNWEGKTREEDPEAKGFIDWVNKTALPALLKWCNERGVGVESREKFTLDEHGRHFEASPNASFGYIYVGAWQVADAEIRYFPDQPERGNFYHLYGELKATGETWKEFPVFEVAGKRGAFSGKPVRIGDRVMVTMNGIGPGTVRAFFVESGFLGLEVKPDQVPDYFNAEQRKKFPTVLIFGAEFEPLTEAK